MSGHKKTLENLNTRKSTSRGILTGILLKIFEHSEQNHGLNIWESEDLDRYDPG